MLRLKNLPIPYESPWVEVERLLPKVWTKVDFIVIQNDHGSFADVVAWRKVNRGSENK